MNEIRIHIKFELIIILSKLCFIKYRKGIIGNLHEQILNTRIS